MSSNPVTLITGANRGLGLQTALRLAERGHHVLVGARDKAAADTVVAQIRAAGHQADAIQIDVTDRSHHAGAILGEEWMGNSVLNVSSDALHQTFDVNFFALIDLTRALVPLLRASAHGRVVNVSSIMGSLSTHADAQGPIWGMKPFAYDASKTALNAFTVHLAQALADDGILVNSAHPGWVKTDLGGEWAPMTVEEGAKTLIDLATLPDGGPTATFAHMGAAVPW
jgi:NAD(P)-dependent dehydrogenase (short-subunit alcohol dehydrogenase family)